jgi:hypothetical protein
MAGALQEVALERAGRTAEPEAKLLGGIDVFTYPPNTLQCKHVSSSCKSCSESIAAAGLAHPSVWGGVSQLKLSCGAHVAAAR